MHLLDLLQFLSPPMPLVLELPMLMSCSPLHLKLKTSYSPAQKLFHELPEDSKARYILEVAVSVSRRELARSWSLHVAGGFREALEPRILEVTTSVVTVSNVTEFVLNNPIIKTC